jgi:hypothetical protein
LFVSYLSTTPASGFHARTSSVAPGPCDCDGEGPSSEGAFRFRLCADFADADLVG